MSEAPQGEETDRRETGLEGPNGQLTEGELDFLCQALHLDASGKKSVIRALLARAGELTDLEHDRCVRAMHKAYERTGSQSADKYQQFVNDQERPHWYPSTAWIREKLGGKDKKWAVAKAVAFGGERYDPTITRVTARQAVRLGPARIIETVREYTGGEPLSSMPEMEAFLQWSRERAHRVGSYDEPYLTNHKPIYTHWDGWFGLLHDAGVLDLLLPERIVAPSVDAEALDRRAREFIRAAHVLSRTQGGALTRDGLVAFVKSRVTDTVCHPERLGLTEPTLIKVCGGWNGLLDKGDLHRTRSGMHGICGVEVPVGEATRRGREEFADEELKAFMVGAAREYGPGVEEPQIASFRQRMLRAARRKGQDVKVPTITAIADRFGSLVMGLAHAGVISFEEAARRGGEGNFGETERLDALEAAMRTCGTALTEATYKRFRDIQLREPGIHRFPSLAAIYAIDKRDRRFAAARRIVLEKRDLRGVPAFITDLRSQDDSFAP